MRQIGILKALCLLVLLQACAVPRPNLDAPTQTDTTRTLRTSFDYLYETYRKDGVRLEDIVLPAIESLRELEPDMRVSVDGRFAEVVLRDEVIYRFDQPAWYAADGWAAVTRNSVWALKGTSPNVAAASWIEITDLVLAAAAASLDREIGYVSRQDLKAVGLAGGDPLREYQDYSWKEDYWAIPGFRMQPAKDLAEIAQVRRQSDAEQAGLKPGDQVLAIDGQPAGNYEGIPLAMQLLGPTGSKIDVTVRSAGFGQSRTITLQRTHQNLDMPVMQQRDGVLYVQVSAISKKTLETLKAHIKDAAAELPGSGQEDMSGIILDLRGTAIANPFATAWLHNVFYNDSTRYYDQEEQMTSPRDRFAARKALENSEIPLVVLANGNTSNGAEPLVAEFADSGRGIVIGSVTRGAGHYEWPLSLGNGALFVHRGNEIKTSSDYPIDKRGVLPMICSAALDSGEAAITQLKMGKGHIDHATRTRKIDDSDRAALQAHRDQCPPEIGQDDKDIRLAEAILEDPALYAAILEADLR